VLVSGCGDSGVIEALHYTIKDFRHEFVENLWPAGVNLEALLDLGLAKAKLDELLLSEEINRYDDRIISELCWWLDTWHRLENWWPEWWLGKQAPHEEPIFQAIELALRPHLLSAFSPEKYLHLEWHEREDFLLGLEMGAQLAVREAVMPLVDHWISRNIETVVCEIPASILSSIQELHDRRRTGVAVTFNGVTPAPYTRQMSSYNVWLARILMTFPNVHYRQGKITSVEAEGPGSYKVTYEDIGQEIYDRVVTRYGPTKPSGGALSSKANRDPHRGSWLLNLVSYTVPVETLGDGAVIGRFVDPAKEDVSRKLPEVLQRRGSGRTHPVNKVLYQQRLLAGPVFRKATGTEYIDSDPQEWLSSKLRVGIRPCYEDDLRFDSLKRRQKTNNIRQRKK
jgi:hypothetical protein